MPQGIGRKPKAFESNVEMGSRTSIIQCPSCQTKFAVRTSQLEEVRNPRFHCSRCDNIFSMEDILITTHPSPLKKAGLDRTSITDSKRNEAFQQTQWEEDSINSAEDSFDEDSGQEESEEYEDDTDYLSESEETEEDFEEIKSESEEEREETQVYRFEDDLEGRAIKEEDRQKEPWRFEAPHSERIRPKEKTASREDPQIVFPFEERDAPFPYMDSQEEEEEEYQDSPISWMDKVLPIQEKSRKPIPELQKSREEDWLADLRAQINETSTEPEAEAPRILRKTPAPTEEARRVPSAAHAKKEGSPLQTPERKTFFREIPSAAQPLQPPVQTTFSDVPIEESFSQRWRSVLIISALLLVALLALSALSISAVSNPAYVRSALSSTLPARSSIPPPGLFISDVQFKNITLENNVEVPAISGKVSNKSDSTFNEVTIIGGLFDKKGTTIIQAKTNLSSPLHRSRIKSLSIEMLNKLNVDGGNKGFKLKPGEKAPFMLPFIDSITQGNKLSKAPAHFAAKVFSASK